ncbi:TPA: dihydrolipoyl dehydrogenase, partial [bacterium]|nr:dihydrolipoyl dehydrogenase [bacterium]
KVKKENISAKICRFSWLASGRAMSMGRTDGLTKIIADTATEKILGAGITGVGAGELISEIVVAMNCGATISDIASSIHPHPTLSETIMEAAELF